MPAKFSIGTSAIATGRGGGGGNVPPPPLTTACAPQFWFTQITLFGTPRNCKTVKMMVKGVIAFEHISPL